MNNGPNIIPMGPFWSIATWLSWEQLRDNSSMHSRLRYRGSTTEAEANSQARQRDCDTWR